MSDEVEKDTLGYHHSMCEAVFGSDSPATKFLAQKIKEAPGGEHEKVICSEHQLIHALAKMHFQESDPPQNMI